MDGSAIDTSFNANHTFTTPGNYNVMFIVNDSRSCNFSDTAFVILLFFLQSLSLLLLMQSYIHFVFLLPPILLPPVPVVIYLSGISVIAVPQPE